MCHRVFITLAILLCLSSLLFSQNYDEQGLEYVWVTIASASGYEVSIGICTEPIITIPAFYDGEYVISIANNGFADNADLRHVVMKEANNLRRIGNGAFAGCVNLLTISMPRDGAMLTIDFSAFAGCESLQRILLATTISHVGGGVFTGCDALTIYARANTPPVNWQGNFNPSGCPVIFGYPLYFEYDLQTELLYELIMADGNTCEVSRGVTAFSEIDIPATFGEWSVVKIADDGFLGYTAVVNVEMADSIIDIGHRAFKGCAGLTEIRLSNALQTLGDEVFSGCVALHDIMLSPDQFRSDLPATLTSIGDYTFADCTSIESLIIPSGVTDMGENPFVGCSDELELDFPGNTEYSMEGHCLIQLADNTLITGFSDSVIPDFVEIIGDRAFFGKDLLSVVLPSSVVRIGDHAFAECVSLQGVVLPPVIEEIDAGAFSDCISLETVTIPNRHRDYGIYRDVVLGEGIFEGCIALVSVELPESFSAVSARMFYGCSSLPAIDLSSVRRIGAFAFAGCEALLHIELPPEIEEIDAGAFSDCISLETVTIPNRQRDDHVYRISLGEGVFAGCTVLVSVEIPFEYTAIGARMFSGCSSLATFTIPDGVTSIGERAFEDCSGLVSIVIPLSVETIGSYAFAGCDVLTICARIDSCPAGWASDFNPDDRPVMWGYLSDNNTVVDLISTELKGNYPNPFNPSTTISFILAREGQVTLDVFNIKGQRIKEVVSSSFSAGRHNVVWNGDDAEGRSVGSGVYFYRMTTAGYSSVQKMVLLK